MSGLDVIKFAVHFEGIRSYIKRFIVINLKSAASMAVLAVLIDASTEKLSIKML